MRVLHVIGDSGWGGGSAVILALAGAGRRLGWAVDILTTDPVTIDAARGCGLGVVEMDVIRRDIRPARDLHGLWRLRAFLRTAGYDLVHTHTSKAGFVGRLAATLARTPVIVHTMHGFAIHEDSPATHQAACALLEKMAARCCHRIVTVSHFHRRWALQLGMAPESKLVTIPNGVPEPAPGAGRAATRWSLGLADHHFAVLSNSRLAAQKGLEDLIHAAALLPGGLAGRVRILLAGDGPLRPVLQEIVRRLGAGAAIRFLGFRADMPDLLAAADLVALPSLREGLSIALLEAMAAGKPVVATSIGSMKEATKNGESAVLVPPGNPVALATALTGLAADPARCARLGRRGREIYGGEYTAGQMMDRYLRVYEELLAARTVVTPLSASAAGAGTSEGGRYSCQA